MCSKWYCSMKKKIWKDSNNFNYDIKSWPWKSKFCNYWQPFTYSIEWTQDLKNISCAIVYDNSWITLCSRLTTKHFWLSQTDLDWYIFLALTWPFCNFIFWPELSIQTDRINPILVDVVYSYIGFSYLHIDFYCAATYLSQVPWRTKP